VTQSDHITFTWNGHCACAVTRDLSPGAKMTPIFGIRAPNLPIDCHFYGATTKIVQSKSVPKMAVFRKCKSLNIKYSYRDVQKALAYPERRVLTYLA